MPSLPDSSPRDNDRERTLGARESLAIWLLLVSAFVVILNETVMGVALPKLMHELDITAAAGQWLTAAFLLTMSVVIPITGMLIQRVRTRTLFIVAMSLFSAGTLLAAVAPGFEILLVGRVVQACGTAIMMPLLMTTLMTVVPAHMRGRMMGRVSVVISLAPAIGPTLSGVILDNLSWRWIFGIVLPVALAALAVGLKWMENIGETRPAPVDVLSVILSALGFGGIVFGLSQIGAASSHGGDADVSAAEAAAASANATVTLVIAFSVGVVALALFVWRQLRLQRVDDALLDLRVFRSTNFTISIVQMLLLSVAFFGAITLLPLYLQRVLELSATESGLTVLPGAIAMGILGPVIGRIYDRSGTRVLLVPGAVITCGVLWYYTTLDENTSVWIITVAQTVLSVGLALSFTPLFTASLGSLRPSLYAHGSAVLGTVQQVAGAAGIALLITVMSAVTATAAASGTATIPAEAAGARVAFLISAIVALPTLVGAFLVRKPADDVEAAGLH